MQQAEVDIKEMWLAFLELADFLKFPEDVEYVLSVLNRAIFLLCYAEKVWSWSFVDEHDFENWELIAQFLSFLLIDPAYNLWKAY